jgi:menaquinone-dependent protoporphyrinogen oxidase
MLGVRTRMTVLILYASVEGQTAKIAKYLESCVRNSGERPMTIDANEKGALISFHDVERVILAASVHRRRHPSVFEKVLSRRKAELERLPTLFLSVSLCAAFDDGKEEAHSYLTDMSARTGFVPFKAGLVAGSLQYDKYHDYEAQVIRLVALGLKKLDAVEEDREFTDWDALQETVSDFLGD